MTAGVSRTSLDLKAQVAQEVTAREVHGCAYKVLSVADQACWLVWVRKTVTITDAFLLRWCNPDRGRWSKVWRAHSLKLKTLENKKVFQGVTKSFKSLKSVYFTEKV